MILESFTILSTMQRYMKLKIIARIVREEKQMGGKGAPVRS